MKLLFLHVCYTYKNSHSSSLGKGEVGGKNGGERNASGGKGLEEEGAIKERVGERGESDGGKKEG
jgi:hypothetical protein